MSTTIDIRALTDQRRAGGPAVQALADAINHSGKFYIDSKGVWVFYENGVARPITRSSEIVHLLINKGMVEFADGRGVLPMHYEEHTANTIGRFINDNTGGLFCPPSIEGIMRVPCVWRPDPAGTWQQGAPADNGGPVAGRLFVGAPADLTAVDPAYPHLKTWLSDIHFLSEIHRGNLIGYAVATLARADLPQFPFLVVDGVGRSVGKTTVAAAISSFISSDVAPMVWQDAQENQKAIAGLAGTLGPTVLFFDNLRSTRRGAASPIRSQFLAVAATQKAVYVRPVYGKVALPVWYPIAIFTMNDSSVDSDLHDRNVRVILDKPGRYFNPHPEEYVKRHRETLIAEGVHLLTQIPPRPPDFEPKTRFREAEYLILEIARRLGFEADLSPDRIDTSDALVKQLYNLICSAVDENGGEPVTMHDLLMDAQSSRDEVPEVIDFISSKGATTDKRREGALVSLIEGLSKRSIYVGGQELRFQLDNPTPGRYNVYVKNTEPNASTKEES